MKYFPLLFFLFLFSCEPPAPKQSAVSEEPAVDTSASQTPAQDVAPPAREVEPPVPAVEQWQLPYDLSKPDETFKLPGRLREISGLGMSGYGDVIFAVNDEDGDIFYILKSTGEVTDKIDFGGGGDYEGVEAVGRRIYVVKSNGNLYAVKDPGKKDQKTKTYKSFLDARFNVEGLGYDYRQNRLLLACKGKAGKGLKGQRAVYAFDLEKKELIEEPAYLIDRSHIEKYFKKEGITQKFIDTFAPDQASDAFAPSGIAVHPKSGNIYIISTVGKLLVVLTPDGEIKHMEKLDADIHRQPEGICFDVDGTLYIASEGRGGKGRILRFPSN